MFTFLTVFGIEKRFGGVSEKKSENKPSPEYVKLEKDYKPAKDFLGKIKPSFSERIKSAVTNVKNISLNAFDNTIGYGISSVQNYSTKRALKKDPSADKPILYMMHGVDQNIGSQWRLGSMAAKEGKRPYHLKAHHSKGPEAVSDEAFKQIGDLHKYSGTKNVSGRKDVYTGHSSGGNAGLYMATDPRISKYGIKHVHARAPSPTGLKVEGLAGKVLSMILDIKPEDVSGEVGRENVLKLHRRGKPKVPVYIMAGKNDYFIPPKVAYYKHAKGMHVIDHPDSTHFGTSGVNSTINQTILELINDPKKYDPIGKQKSKYREYKV